VSKTPFALYAQARIPAAATVSAATGAQRLGRPRPRTRRPSSTWVPGPEHRSRYACAAPSMLGLTGAYKCPGDVILSSELAVTSLDQLRAAQSSALAASVTHVCVPTHTYMLELLVAKSRWYAAGVSGPQASAAGPAAGPPGGRRCRPAADAKRQRSWSSGQGSGAIAVTFAEASCAFCECRAATQECKSAEPCVEGSVPC